MTTRLWRPIMWVILAAALMVPAGFFLQPLERAAFDFRLRLRRETPWPQDLVLVPIDDAAMRTVGRWPWSRARMADLLEALNADGVKTVLYDFSMAVPTSPEDDARMAGALSRAVLAVPPAHGEWPESEPVLQKAMISAVSFHFPKGKGYRARDLVAPLAAFADHAKGLGQLYTPPDGDQVIRGHYPLLPIDTANPESGGSGDDLDGSLPSLPLAAWLAQHGFAPGQVKADPGALLLPDGRGIPLYNGEMFLDIASPSTRPARVEAGEVLAHPGAADLVQKLAGKLAVLHVDELSLHDYFATPGSTATPGGLLLAYDIRSLEYGRVPRPVPLLPLMAGCFTFAAVLAGLLVRLSPARIQGLSVAAALLVLLAGAALARVDLFPPVVLPAAFFLASGALLSLQASRMAESDRTRLRELLAASMQASGQSAAPRVGPAVPAERATRLNDATDPVVRPPAGTEALVGGVALSEPVEVSHYRVERSLGRGGMGAIFLALDRDLDRYVALKILEAADEEAFHRFRREAMAVARIAHPNVVQIHEVGLDASVPYLVMEYVPGGTLSDYLRDPDIPSPLPWLQSTRIALGIARGLGAAHAVGIVHRDVKPSNVLMTTPGSDAVKLADFGIAKLSGAESLTQEGSFIGTVGYMSPEQATGVEVDARSDVYSLGVVWYRMLTGRAAFEGSTAQVLRNAVTQSLPDPRKSASMPAAVAELLMRMTAVDRAERIADGVEAAQALEKLLREVS